MLANEALELLGLIPTNIAGDVSDPGRAEQFRPLVNWHASNSHKQGAIKWGVLTQIGRIKLDHGEEVAFQVAEEITKALAKGTRSREAELRIRAWRMKLARLA
jgi:hypothetical protein